MKIFLDDLRQNPEGWILAKWPSEVIEYLKTGKVTHLSLDHDLGNDEKGTGYDVITWLEEKVFFNPEFKLPKIKVHSANPVAKRRMEAGVYKILKNT